MERVFVTGMGVASPLGCDVEIFWERLKQGQSGVSALEGEEFAHLRTRIGARVPPYNEADYYDRKDGRRMSRTSQLALVAAHHAIQQAKLDQIDPVRVGIMIGSSIGGFSASDYFYRDYYRSGRESPFVIPTCMNSGPSSQVSIRYGYQGPLMSVDAACSSAAHSIGYAMAMIRSGIVDVVVTGGADSPFTTGVMAGWCAMRALSERNDSPAAACRPFSADRDGLVLGEGAGVLILESERSARQRQQPMLAEMLGYGATSDGHHITQPIAEGPARAMQAAMADAHLTPDQIDYVNAHGTGTPWNDGTETAAIKLALGDHAYQVPVVSNKSALGHSIAGSGALELIGCVLSLRDQQVPPTINFHVPDPECDLDYVTSGCRHLPMQHIMSNSFSFGGSNAVLIVGVCN
jgi:beta-ketoacyl-acyl-carrier-protein synthase II